MIALAQTTTAYALLVGLGCLISAVRARPRPKVLDLALVVAGLGALGVAGTAAYRLLVGDRPAEYGVHLGYLITTALILPLIAVVVRGERTRWGSATFAVGCLALAVVIVRLITTGR